MSRVLVNNISLAYAIEESIGVLAGSPVWYTIEPNTISKFGADITTITRTPISKNRQLKKGTITDLDSGVEFEADITRSHIQNFLEGFAFAELSEILNFAPTAVTATGYTVASDGDLPQYTLVYARGFGDSANNGLKVVATGSTATEIKASGLVVDASPATNVEVSVTGYQGVSGDLEVDASGDIISTTLDFTTLDLTVGQVIWVGGSTTATQFAVTANTGYARITAIATNKLTLDKKSTTFTIDDGATKTIQLLFGRFLRNVSVDHASYLERSFQFEAAYPDLGGVGVDNYEYAKGNFCNTLAFNLPLADKATLTFGFTGTDTEVPTTSRKTNADSAIEPNSTTAYNTTSDVARLRITEVDETGLTTDFKNISLTLNNNVSPEKVISTLGAKYMNAGIFEVSLEAQLIFTDPDVVTAIRNNTTVTMDFALKNDNGGIFVDIPAMTLGGGNKDYPINESLLINITSSAFEDPTLGTSLGISLFPYLP